MKRSILIIILLTGINIFPQTIKHYGIKLGYVSAGQTNLIKSIDEITVRKSGFSISGFIELFDFNGFFISPELKYIQKGSGQEFVFTGQFGPEPIGEKVYYIYHSYLSIPSSIGYKEAFEFGTLIVKVAPRYDILLNSDNDFEYDLREYEKYKNVFGATFSTGYIPELDLTFKPFIEIAYHMDLQDTYSGKYNKIRNNAVEVCIGVRM